jgi:hypothetical protein
MSLHLRNEAARILASNADAPINAFPEVERKSPDIVRSLGIPLLPHLSDKTTSGN